MSVEQKSEKKEKACFVPFEHAILCRFYTFFHVNFKIGCCPNRLWG